MKQLFQDSEIPKWSEVLLSWYEKNKRNLPWRVKYSPYEIWISEMMLQQTQMERGIQYFQRWMQRFPNVFSVAEASENEILKYWEGLGYYSRARLLHSAAKKMVSEFQGNIPHGEKELATLPGLGEYTVAAIRSIAFNEDTTVCDANVERVFSRLLNIEIPVKQKEAATIIRKYALLFLTKGRARLYNQAIMEFGALVCSKKPRCEICPFISICAAHSEQTQNKRPVISEKKTIIPVYSVHGIISYQRKIILFRRKSRGLWKNMWEFPGTEYAENKADFVLREYLSKFQIFSKSIKKLCEIRHGYTNHRLIATFFLVKAESLPDFKQTMINELPEYTFSTLGELKEFPMAAHHRKAADFFLNFHKNKGIFLNSNQQLLLL